MRNLIIVARNSMLSDLEELLHKNGITAYSILNNVMGMGGAGRVYGTFLSPEINTIIFAVLPSDQVNRAVIALRTLHTERIDAAPNDTPIPIKVFSSPCEEHL